jgi:L-iditol 2-dehydrogenase
MKAIEFNPTVLRYAIGRAMGRTLPGVLWGGLSCTRYVDVPERSLPGEDWVRIKTGYGGICGTDLSTIRLHTSMSLTPFCSFPNILGHEGVGHISEVGPSVLDFQVGERVVVEPLLWCTPRGITKPCEFCQRGEVSLCEHATDGKLSAGMSIGFCRDTGGSWSEGFVAHRSQLYRIPDGTSDKNALMVEPFSTGLHAVLNNMPGDDETVIILGAGTIGLCVIAALRALGSKARLLVLARHDFQASAAEKFGASSVILGGESHAFYEVAKSLGAKIKKPMMGDPVMVGGADRVFECVGSESSISNALGMTRSGGRVVLVGMPSTLRLDWTPISVKELTVNASWAYHHAEVLGGRMQSTFEIALGLMNRGKVNLEWMITHVFRLQDYKRAFEMLGRRGNHRVIKAAFGFD